jgi:hypothetical protein
MRFLPVPTDRIKVFLRMRPLLSGEKSIDFSVSDHEITVHPPKTAPSSTFCIDKLFSFRNVFDHNVTQADVFETVAAPLLDDFLHGSDVLIFCYGSTNAGKTYTISGSKQDPGLLKRSLETIVEQKNASQSIRVSFFEIYNEIIYDLLDTSKPKESKRLGVNDEGETEVKNLIEIEISSLAEATTAFERGEAGRHRGFTEFNPDSSRSHTICRIRLTNRRKHCCLSIVDLAGCERLSIMNSSAGSFKEACNINKSMLVLGKCIRQLKEQGASGKKASISYRESKLTHLFKSFFEPINRPAQAAIVINASPSYVQLEDTIFALQFAAEASQCVIRQTIVVQEEEEEEEPEDFESLTRNRVKLEMDIVLARQQQHTEETIEKLTLCCEKHQSHVFKDQSGSIVGENEYLEERVAELNSGVAQQEEEYANRSVQIAALLEENSALNEMVNQLKKRIQSAQSTRCGIALPPCGEGRYPSLPCVSEELVQPLPLPD